MRTAGRITKLGAALAISIGAVSQACAQGGFAPPELAIHQIRDDIYVIRSGASGNVTVLVSDDGVALVDDKFEMDHDGIMELVRSVTDQPVRYVINTHLHADHTGGNALMQAADAEIIASENARRIMTETLSTGLPNLTFDDHMRLFLGGKPIDLYYLGRGHTDGDIVVHLPEERIVIMGDLFAIWGPPQHLIDYGSGGSARDWSRTLERALQLDFDTVIPGHSGVTDRAMLEGFLAETVKLQQMVREMNRQKRTREEIQAVLESEFNWGQLSISVALDGIIAEFRQ